jgi:hypothetical protein
MPTTTTVRPHLHAEWFDAIRRRISRRRFDGPQGDSSALDRIDETCHQLGTSATGARTVLVREAPQDVFTGFVGSYGKIVGAPSLVAFIGGDDSLIDVGYLGEAVILDATAAGLDTCWIAGSFSAAAAAGLVLLADGERVCAVTPLGHGAQKRSGAERLLSAIVKPRARLSLDEIAPGSSSWPGWAQEAAEAVRLGPSGANRQPWRLRMDGGSLLLRATPKAYWTAPMDLGIAMLHAELGALHAGVLGTWDMLSGDDVARFVPEDCS